MHVEVLKCHDEKVNHFQKIKMRVVKISMNVRSIKTNHHSKGHRFIKRFRAYSSHKLLEISNFP